MAATTKDKPLKTASTGTSGTGFGAYGAGVNSHEDLARAIDKAPDSKLNGSLDFTNADKRWLKELGITTTPPASHHAIWRSEQEKYNYEHRKWNESIGGRVAMRSVSRGIVGAMFYAAGNLYAHKALNGYTYNRLLKEAEGGIEAPEGFLQHIARIIDKTVGEGIFQVAKIATKGNEARAIKAVTFCDTRNFGYQGPNGPMRGRSLGPEAVAVTFDFACMSFGDYMTRYFIGLFDPNAKAHWMKDGHLDVPGGLKDLFKNIWRGVFYAAGEDMAVALPYVYGMRLQRHMIDKYSPGFKFDSDYRRNGGSFKIRDGKVIGDYQLEGALDLMGRFSWYNVGTKMFRDTYGRLAERLTDWWRDDRTIHAPHIDPRKLTPQHIGQSIIRGIRYAVRTTVKVMVYMIPATFFFYITRTPQSKVRGLAIDAEKGLLGRNLDTGPPVAGSIPDEDIVGELAMADTGRFKPVKPGSNFRGRPVNFSELYYQDAHGNAHDYGRVTADTYPFDPNPMTSTRKQAFGISRNYTQDNVYYRRSGVNPPWYDRISNPIARFNYWVGSVADKSITSAVGKLNFIGVTGDPTKIEHFARLYGNAAVSYFPYFAAKTDIFSSLWDTSRTDMGLDRSLDGAGAFVVGFVTFNGRKMNHGLGEFVMGLKEFKRSMLHEPFTDPKREEQAQRERWGADIEHASNEAYQLSERGRDLYSAGGQKRQFAHDSLKNRPFAPSPSRPSKGSNSWTTQEAVRKFQDTDQQGQSVH